MIRNENLRVALDTFFLTKVGVINAVDFGKLNVFVLEGSCSFFVMRSQGFAVTTPIDLVKNVDNEMNVCSADHGAKNSTKTSGSGFTTVSKSAAVRLITSDKTSSATTKAARVTREAVIRKRILVNAEVNVGNRSGIRSYISATD
jgi:hypothetical protein